MSFDKFDNLISNGIDVICIIGGLFFLFAPTDSLISFSKKYYSARSAKLEQNKEKPLPNNIAVVPTRVLGFLLSVFGFGSLFFK